MHDQSIAFSEFRLRTELGLTDRFGVALMLPFRALRTDIRYLDQADAEVELVNSNTHHRNETLTGVGDPWLLGRYGVARGRTSIELQLGASIPLGRTEEDPFALGDAGLVHQHMQFGTGTVNPIISLELARRFERWSVSGYALTMQMLYENSKGYQAGDRYGAGLAAESPLGTTRWGFRVGTDLQGETRELWNGVSHPDEGNQGRIDWLLSAGVRRRLGDDYELTATVKLPLVTHAVGGQLDFPAMVDVGISGSFALFGGGGGAAGGAEEEHDHGDEHDHEEHDHGDDRPRILSEDRRGAATESKDHGNEAEHDHGQEQEHAAPVDWTGIDVAEISTDGTAAPLTPVAGRITVFDFWAPWCKPCKVLDAELAALARKYPDRISIRKLDVVDWDSEAAARYLAPGGFNLPHIKVFDAAGVLRFERSGDPHALAKAVETLLR